MKHEQKQVYLRDIEIEHCIISPETYTFSFTVPPKIEILDHNKKTHTYDVIKLLDKLSKNIDVGELAYLQKENSDLKDEVDLLQKQLEIAVDALKRANNTYCAEEEDITIDLTESAAHKWQRTAYQMAMPISIALEQITATLENKNE